MHPAALSIKAFGIYAAVTGVGLLIAPNVILAPLGVPATAEVWIRVVGTLAVVIGYYYWACGIQEALAFFKATVKGRFLYAVLTVSLIAIFQAPMQLLLFAAIDVAGAIWTWRGLREAKS